MRHSLFACVPFVLAIAVPALAAESDAEFVDKTANVGMLEVELGRYASQHAASPSVRSFGQQMVADHSKANVELNAIAQRSGLTVPAALDAEHKNELDKLTKKTGSDFDKAYMEMMVDGHTDTVQSFRDQAKEAKTEVDRFAAKTLPTLEKHLSQAKSIQDNLQAKSDAAGHSHAAR